MTPLTICILHYNKLPQLKKTVDCLFKNTQVDFNLRILNNGYLDAKIEKYLEELQKKDRISVMFSNENLGCPPGRYQCLKGIETEFVVTLDDDIYVPQGWFSELKPVFEKYPNVGGVGFVLLNKEGEIDSIGGRNIEVKNNIVKTSKPEILPSQVKNEVIQVDDLSGGAMVFKKNLLDDFSWDPNYFVGFGDLDKGLQLKETGYNFYIHTNVQAVHDKISKKKDKKKYNKARRDYHEIRRSYLYFVDKWGYRLPWKRHLFYKYFCLLPNTLVRKFVYYWLSRG